MVVDAQYLPATVNRRADRRRSSSRRDFVNTRSGYDIEIARRTMTVVSDECSPEILPPARLCREYLSSPVAPTLLTTRSGGRASNHLQPPCHVADFIPAWKSGDFTGIHLATATIFSHHYLQPDALRDRRRYVMGNGSRMCFAQKRIYRQPDLHFFQHSIKR